MSYITGRKYKKIQWLCFDCILCYVLFRLIVCNIPCRCNLLNVITEKKYMPVCALSWWSQACFLWCWWNMQVTTTFRNEQNESSLILYQRALFSCPQSLKREMNWSHQKSLPIWVFLLCRCVAGRTVLWHFGYHVSRVTYTSYQSLAEVTWSPCSRLKFKDIIGPSSMHFYISAETFPHEDFTLVDWYGLENKYEPYFCTNKMFWSWSNSCHPIEK